MMMRIASLAALVAVAAAGVTVEPPAATTRAPSSTLEPSLGAIESTAATVVPLSPTSNVPGAGFDRIIQIWLENTDFNASAADPNMQWLATQGILLTNYFASMPYQKLLTRSKQLTLR